MIHGGTKDCVISTPESSFDCVAAVCCRDKLMAIVLKRTGDTGLTGLPLGLLLGLLLHSFRISYYIYY